jgi:iron complex transport system substrate-binding protein
VLALALVIVTSAGCSGTDHEEAAASPRDIVVTDVLDRTVRLPRPAKRIASLSPGFTETLFEVGCGERIVLRDLWSDHPAAAQSIPQADGTKPSVRHVAGFDPDLVLLYLVDPTAIAAFEKVGLTVVALDPRSFDEVVADVIKIGLLCGAERRAEQVAGQMTTTRDRVRRAVAQSSIRPLTYVEIDGADPVRPWTAGPGSFVHELLTIAGARNVAETVSSPYAQVSAESVIRADPQLIVMLDGKPEQQKPTGSRLAKRPGWSALRAVRQGHVVDSLDRDVLSRPGPRLAQGLEQLYETLHAGSK